MAKRMDKQLRREQILEAALSLASGGLGEVTVQRVARLVGVVPSALYRHFANKDALVMAMLDRLGEVLSGIVDQAVAESPDPLAALQRILLLHARLATERRGIPRVLFSDEVAADQAGKGARILALQRGLMERLAGIVRQGREQGIIRADLPARDMAFMVFGLMVPTAVLHYLSGWRSDIFARVEANQRLLAACLGVGTREESK